MINKSRLKDGSAVERHFKVPADMLLDILFVLVENDILYQITEVNRDDGHVMVCVNSKDQPDYYDKAIENIEVMLDEYNDFVRLCDVR